MLLAAYAVDLRGVPTRPAGPGRLLVRRRDVPQVLPKPGEYRVICTGSAGERPGTVRIEAESIHVAARGGGDITTVQFSDNQ